MATKPRSIFEEVATTERPVASTGAIDRGQADARRWVRLWLVVLMALVVTMVLVGGLTRLTESGLSITEWNVVTGTLPPLSQADWQREFALYQASPQYQAVNQGMTLAEFRSIYWWEWAHRLLGRVVGAAWVLGYLGFLLTRRLPAGWATRLLIPGVLIGLQGAVGWWMVSSGLEEGMVAVASYRLAVHLGLAFAILGLLLWDALLLGRTEASLMTARRQGERRLFGVSTGLMHLLFLQVLFGALVAGIDAGRAFPTWPLMGDGFLPPDPFGGGPWWRAFVEDPGLVQFVHRTSGYLVAILAVVTFLRARRSPHPATRQAFLLVLGAVALQVGLGIWAVLSQAQLHVAITHQATAILLWLLVVRGRFLARHPVTQSVRAAR